MDKKKIIIISGIVVIVAILATIATLLTKSKDNKISNLEKIKIEEFINDFGQNLEQVNTDESSEIDRYISFALYHNMSDSNKIELSVKEIKEVIDKVFNLSISEEEIKNIGITPYLLSKFVRYGIEEEKFELDISNLRNADIARVPIIKYELSSIKKKKEDVYTVELMKYKVADPYEILNYYIDKSEQDTKDISNYLSGKNNIKVMKNALTLEALRNIKSESTKVKVTFIVKDNKLLIDSIN